MLMIAIKWAVTCGWWELMCQCSTHVIKSIRASGQYTQHPRQQNHKTSRMQYIYSNISEKLSFEKKKKVIANKERRKERIWCKHFNGLTFSN